MFLDSIFVAASIKKVNGQNTKPAVELFVWNFSRHHFLSEWYLKALRFVATWKRFEN